MNNKKKVLLIILLIIAIIGIGVCGFFLGKSVVEIPEVEKVEEKVEEENTDKTEVKEEEKDEAGEEEKEETKTEKVYTYSDVIGQYEYVEKSADSDMPDYHFTVSLSSKGLFKEEKTQQIPWGSLGNYIIEGNKLKLYSYFETGSDISIYYSNDNPVIILEINDDGSLSMTDNGKKIILKKESSKCDENLFDSVGAYIVTLEKGYEEYY